MNDRRKIFWVSYVYLVFLILLRLIPILIPDSRTWGFNHLLFLPEGFTYGFFAIALFALIIPFVKKSEVWGEKTVGWFSSTFFESRRHIFNRIIFVLLLTIFFIAFTAPTHFLGDGYVVINNLITDSPTIYKWSEIGITWLIGIISSIPGSKDESTVRLAFQAVSIVSGAISIYFVFLIAEVMSANSTKRALVVLTSIFSGSLLLFFGYVEYYPLLWMLSALLLYFGLRFLKYKRGLVFVWLFFLIGMILHIQMIIFSPAVVYISFAEGRGRAFFHGFKKMIIGAIIAVSVTFVSLFIYYFKTNLYVEDIFLPLFTGKPIDPDYAVFSSSHLLDIFNQFILISPLVFLWILICGKNPKKIIADRVAVFLGLLTAASLLFLLVIDPKLAMPRDWDLFSLTVYSPTLLFILLINENRIKTIGQIFPILTLISFISILPFFMVNLNRNSSEKNIEYIIDNDRGKSLSSLVVLMEYYKLLGNERKYDSLMTIFNSGYFRNRVISTAMDSALSGNINSALSYNQLIKPDRFDGDYQHLQAVLNYSNGRYDNAIDHINKAVQLRPFASDYYWTKSRIYFAMKKYESSMISLRKSYHLNPKKLHTIDAIAMVFDMMNKPDSCIYYAQKTLEFDSTRFGSFRQIIKSLAEKRQLDSAKIYMDKYARLAEADSSLRPNLGILEKLLNDNKK